MSNQHRVVSSESEELILVDRDDKEIGFISKADAHDGAGVLHRAFSLFLFNDEGELLLQPRRGESMQVATSRRMLDELNFETDLEYVYQFCYEARFGEAGSENELCHVYLGRTPGQVRPNDSEIAAIRFVSMSELDADLREHPERFTPWFKQEYKELRENYSEQLGRYGA